MTQRTTYSLLTHDASDLLHQSLVTLSDDVRGSCDTGGARSASDAERQDASAVGAFPAVAANRAVAPLLPEVIESHLDVVAALAHLGRTLHLPIARAGQAPPRRRSSGDSRDQKLVRHLDSLGCVRPWEATGPDDLTARRLLHASRLIRAAADLWATHRTADGSPRSPEASRMRHPATLGAAMRELRALATITTGLAATLVGLVDARTDEDTREVPHEHISRLRSITELVATSLGSPAPARARTGTGDPVADLRLTVANPGRMRTADALDRISDVIDRLRRLTWGMAEQGAAPAPVLANTAAIGVMLHRAAAAVHREAGNLDAAASTAHLEAALHEEAQRAAWLGVGTLVSSLRTAHPARTAIQIDRLDLSRLLDQVTTRTSTSDLHRCAEQLSSLARAFDEVAAFHARGVRATHGRGELYVAGRSLPREVITRRPDLLPAKLADEVVPILTVTARRVEDAFLAIARAAAGSVTSDRTPAA